MLPKLAIFDLDGTLLNTIEDVADCFNQALAANNFPIHSLEEVISLVGGDLETIVGNLLPLSDATSDNIELVKTSYKQIYSASPKSKTKPYEGIPDFLIELADSNVSLAINTNKGQDLAETCVHDLLPNLAIPIAGYREDVPSKPNPFGVNKLLRHANCSNKDAVYIGDGISDVLTANNAEIKFIYCAWGQGSEEAVSEIDSNVLVAESVQQLHDILFEGIWNE